MPPPRNRSQQWWYVATALVVMIGVFLIVLTKTDSGGGGNAAVDRPRADFDHWHAAIGVNVCGEWLPNAPEFDLRAGTDVPAGINTKGDGLIHIQPAAADESGENATLGLFMEFGGWEVTADSFSVWGDVAKTAGDECDGEEAEVRWSVDGDEQSGDPSVHRLGDLEVIAIALLPGGEEIGEPPSAGAVFTPADMGQGSDTTLAGETTTTAGGDVTTPGESTPPGQTTPGASTTIPGETPPPTSTETTASTETTVPEVTSGPTSASTATTSVPTEPTAPAATVAP